MGNKSARRLGAGRKRGSAAVPCDLIVPIKQTRQILQSKPTGMQPFPALPAFPVAITIL